MAVEIRELVIKATIIQDEDGAKKKGVADTSSIDRALLIQECVKEVIKIIENNKNR